MKRLGYLMFVLSMMGLSACVTSIPVKIRRAPELNLIGVKTLHVEPFKVNGNLDLDVGNTGKGLLGAVAGVAVDAGVNKLAERKHPGIQQQHLDGLRGVIVSDGYYQVVEDGKPTDGKLTGAIQYEVNDEGNEETVSEKVDNKKVEKQVYTLVRTAKVTLRLQVTGADGKMLGATELTAEAQDKETRDKRDQARDDIEEWDSLVRKALGTLQHPTLQRIAPYFVTERRTLAKGDSDTIKEANKTAARGEWKAAAQMWSDAGQAGTGKDKLAATYNLGVYAEVEGRLDDALKQFQEAKASDAKYNVDVARIENRIQEEERMKAARDTEAPSDKT
jgi:hypothetical protein